MTVLKDITITPSSKGGTIARTIATDSGYQWLVISSTSPILIMSYEVANTGENPLDFKVIGARGQIEFDPASDRFSDIVEEAAVVSGASAVSDVAGVNIHHRTIAIGVKSTAASGAYVVLGVSV